MILILSFVGDFRVLIIIFAVICDDIKNEVKKCSLRINRFTCQEVDIYRHDITIIYNDFSLN